MENINHQFDQHESSASCGELLRYIPGITQAVLAVQLRELESYGVIFRKVYAQVSPKVENFDFSPPPLTEAAIIW